MNSLRSDMLPYASRRDAYPYGYVASAQDKVLSDRLDILEDYINREIPRGEPAPLRTEDMESPTLADSDLLIEGGLHGVVLSTRSIVRPDGKARLGVCTMTIEGFRAGTLSWVTIPPNGITNDFELGRVEAGLGHELLHSVGLGHCATSRCLMYPNHREEALYEFALRKNDGLCADHRLALRGIAQDRNYFRVKNAA